MFYLIPISNLHKSCKNSKKNCCKFYIILHTTVQCSQDGGKAGVKGGAMEKKTGDKKRRGEEKEAR